MWIPTECDYAWAAGFVEADGSFSLNVVSRKSKHGTEQLAIMPNVQASQVNPAPLIKLIQIAYHKDSKKSKLFFETKSNGVIAIHANIVGRARLEEFLLRITPHISGKQKQVALLLEALKIQKPKGGNGKSTRRYTAAEFTRFREISTEIKTLNKQRKYILSSEVPNLEVDAK